jgi:periplasmic protein TonB
LDIAINNSRINENGIIWAITASILLHVLVAVVVPNFNFTYEKETPPILKIELVQPAPPAPAPIEEPLPPINIPEPPKPEPIKKNLNLLSNQSQSSKKRPLSPTVEQPEVATPQVVEEVIAVQPSPERAAEVVVPQPTEPIEPPTPPQPSQVDIDSALSAYGNMLGRAIAKHKSYPKIAERRGWEGTALLDLKIDSQGNVVSATVRDSSGYEALDSRALEMVKKASPFPAPPKELQGRTFNISVPVSFKLATG